MHPKNLQKQKIIEKINEYIANCDTALKAGAGSEFGSASGAIHLNGAKQAFEELKEFVEKLL